jgi:hypothetical protein
MQAGPSARCKRVRGVVLAASSRGRGAHEPPWWPALGRRPPLRGVLVAQAPEAVNRLGLGAADFSSAGAARASCTLSQPQAPIYFRVRGCPTAKGSAAVPRAPSRWPPTSSPSSGQFRRSALSIRPEVRDPAPMEEQMIVKIALAALVGALSGTLVATRGVFWPPLAGTHASCRERVIARVEAASNTLRHHNAP